MELEGLHAIVTGGDRGIGRVISLSLADKNVNVAVNFHKNEENAKETTKEIQSKGVEAMKVQADVSDFSQVQKMVNQVRNNFGSIEILVNNAGITGEHSALEDITPEEWRRVIEVNLTGAFNCAKAVAPELKQNQGKIVNISSISGRTGGLATGCHYDASKAGIIGLTFGLARELAPQVTVNAVAPGPVDTGILSEEAKERLRQETPFKRIARPEEIAHAVIFLLENDYVAGEVVDVNAARYLD